MSENIEQFINALNSNNMVGAQDAFNAELNDRMNAALDAKKIEVASSMFGDANDVSTDDIDDEDMEIDIEEEEEVE